MKTLTAPNPLRQAVELFRAGRLADAEAIARRSLETDRRNGDAMSLIGLIEYERGRFDSAEQWHRKAIAADRRNPLFICNLATTFTARGRLRDALAQYERALKVRPGYVEALTGKADVLERRGKADRAAEVLAPLVRGGSLTSMGATIQLRLLLQPAKEPERVVEFVSGQLKRQDLRSDHRRSLLLGLGKARDALGDCDGAFDAYVAANAIDSRPFDVKAVVEMVDTLIEVFSAERMEALPRATHGSRVPVFIVGLPRCGSTLVEQIVHAHPDAHGAGEIPDLAELLGAMPGIVGSDDAYPHCVGSVTSQNLNQCARVYLDRLRKHGGKAMRIVDKSLINFERLGVISLLLPEASVIHVRRHPLDQCLSCFMADLPPQLHPYSTDLANLGGYYRQYARLMRFWRDHPHVRMLELDYEDLVADQEGLSRRIIDFVGLEWDDRVLRFHEAKRDVGTMSYGQVRQPIYKAAVARYQRYERHLKGLKEALGDVLDREADSPDC